MGLWRDADAGDGDVDHALMCKVAREHFVPPPLPGPVLQCLGGTCGQQLLNYVLAMAVGALTHGILSSARGGSLQHQ